MSNKEPARPEEADVVVVGAGPAGAMTALLLARRGLRVTLIDRAAFPRPKPCGDCLSAAATELLRRHGLLERLVSGPHAWLDGWVIESPAGRAALGRLRDTRALAIERRVLDAALLDAARKAGARFEQARVRRLIADDAGPERVRGVTARGVDGGELRRSARLVVGADGLRSVVARRLGVIRRRPSLRKVSLTAHAAMDGAALQTTSPGRKDGLRLGRMRVLDGGSVGVAPVADGRLNLTVVVEERHAATLADIGPEAFAREWLRTAGVGPPLPEDCEILASGPFDWPVRTVTRRGAALVGDAAGYYDPFTGQGVYQAIAGAEALVREVAPVLESRGTGPGASATDATFERSLDAALARYACAHRRLTRPARRVQRLIEMVLSRPRLADRALGRLTGAPRAMDRLVEVTGDLRHPRSLLSPRVLSSFLIPATPEVQ